MNPSLGRPLATISSLRPALALLTALAAIALLLTACGGEEPDLPPAGASPAAGSASPVAAASSDPTAAPAVPAAAPADRVGPGVFDVNRQTTPFRPIL